MGRVVDIIKSDVKTQEAFLLGLFPDESIEDLIVKIYSEAFGVYLLLDRSRLEDMLGYPTNYDLGETIREHLPDTTDDRVTAIDIGAPLTAKELAALKDYILDEQSSGDGGHFCSGFDVRLPNGQVLFASFVGLSEGQGGIGYEFDGLFLSRQSAKKSYKERCDLWLDL